MSMFLTHFKHLSNNFSITPSGYGYNCNHVTARDIKYRVYIIITYLIIII